MLETRRAVEPASLLREQELPALAAALGAKGEIDADVAAT